MAASTVWTWATVAPVVKVMTSAKAREVMTAAALPGRFRLTAGKARRYRKIGDSGQPSDQFFCSGCGSPLWRESADGEIGLRLGCIDQRRAVAPKHQSFGKSALPFVFAVQELPEEGDD